MEWFQGIKQERVEQLVLISMKTRKPWWRMITIPSDVENLRRGSSVLKQRPMKLRETWKYFATLNFLRPSWSWSSWSSWLWSQSLSWSRSHQRADHDDRDHDDHYDLALRWKYLASVSTVAMSVGSESPGPRDGRWEFVTVLFMRMKLTQWWQ